MTKYIVTENEVFVEDSGKTTLYGVCLTDDEGTQTGYLDISSIRAVAEGFAELCRRNSVGATSFFEVLEDYVADI